MIKTHNTGHTFYSYFKSFRGLLLSLAAVTLNFIFFSKPLYATQYATQKIVPPITIQLSKIIAEKTAEKDGDQIYISILDYSNEGQASGIDANLSEKATEKASEKRIPYYPETWSSKDLDLLKDIPLWTGHVPEGETKTVIITVVAQHSPPWDVDDPIGSAKITIVNDHGSLKTEWSLPIFEEKAEHHSDNNKFSERYVFSGDNAKYVVFFKAQ